MIEVNINEKYLDKFISDLRFEDKLELMTCYNDSLEEFYSVCLDKTKQTYFVVDENYMPLALGGAYEIFGKKEKCARLWLLATNKISKNKITLYKYVKKKIDYFKKEYDVLFNFIYKSNFESLKLLKANGFNVYDLENFDYKLFYFCKGELDFDIRHFTS